MLWNTTLYLLPLEYRDRAPQVLDDKVGFDLVADYPKMADLALFSTGYPHSICLWPDTKAYIETSTVNCPPEATKKFLAGKAVKLFNLICSRGLVSSSVLR
ncbi:MAG: hypothetical protein ABIM50_02430 [Novosphingobium sp.]